MKKKKLNYWPDWVSETAKKKFIEMVRKIKEYEKIHGPIYMKKVYIIVFTHYHPLSLNNESTSIHPFAFTTEKKAKECLAEFCLNQATAEIMELEIKEKTHGILSPMQSTEKDAEGDTQSS